MRGTRRLIALVVGAVVVAGVATILVAGGSDEKQDSGRYAGLSDQRLPVRLTASKDRRRLSLDVSWVAHCGRKQSTTPVEVTRTVKRSAVRVAADGSFSWRGTVVESRVRRYMERQRMRMRLRGRRADDGTVTGTWRAERSLFFGPRTSAYARCRTGDVTFRARPDGSLRLPAPLTDRSGNRVFALQGAPDVVAAGAGGVWVLSAAPARRAPTFRRTLSQVDPRTGAIMSRTLQAAGSTLIKVPFAAGEGAGWLAVPGTLDVAGAPEKARLTLARLDARTHAVTSQPDPLLEGYLREMSVGAGAVWLLVQTSLRQRKLLRASPRDGSIQHAIALPPAPRFHSSRCFGLEDAQVAAGTAGAVWVSSTGAWNCAGGRFTARTLRNLPNRSKRLRRIDPRSNRVTRTITLKHGYDKLTGSATDLWATTCADAFTILTCEREARLELHRLSTRDGRPVSVTRLPAGRVIGLAATRDAVWISHIATTARRGTLMRVDRATGRRSTVLTFEGAPSNVSIGEGGVWVVDTFARTLIRVPAKPPTGDPGPDGES